jgi:ABC-type multidrug transport system ATPase subunit
VLVTNSLNFLPFTDHVIFIENGQILAQGSFQQINKSEATFGDFFQSIKTTTVTSDVATEISAQNKANFSQIGQVAKQVGEKFNKKEKLIVKEKIQTGNVS